VTKSGPLDRHASGAPVTAALLGVGVLVAAHIAVPFDVAYGSAWSRFELVLYTIAQALAVVGAGIAALRVVSDRLFWSLLTLACTFVLVYDLPWTFTVWQGNPPPTDGTTASLFLVILPATLFLILIATMTRMDELAWPARLKFIVGGLIVLTAVFVAYLVMFVRPLFSAWESAEVTHVLRLSLHGSIGVGMLLGTAATVMWLNVSAWRPWEKLFVAAFTVYGSTLALTPIYNVVVRLAPSPYSQLHETLLMVGPGLVFAAAVARLGDGRDHAPLIRYGPTGYGRVWIATVFACGAIAVAGFLALAAVLAPSGSFDEALYASAATIMLVLLGAWLIMCGYEVAGIMRAVTVDRVSGAHSVAHFHETLARELDLSHRHGAPLSVLFVDIDGFHRYVETSGAECGERLLRQVAEAIREVIGSLDRVCRLEDDLFACVFPGIERRGGHRIAESIRAAVREESAMTVSVGVAVFPEHGFATAELVDACASALRWAKVHGKDRVEFFSEDQRKTVVPSSEAAVPEGHAHVASVRSLAAAVDSRHLDTRYHSQGVADLAVLVARDLGLDDERVRLIEQAALMHDIGKIGLPDAILGKPGRLTAEEYARVQEHPVLGERIVASTALAHVAPWIRSHHERWDGTGYPDGLSGGAIPLESRIISACDAYDVITSPRAYRARLSADAAVQEIDLGMGTQFDPVVGEALIAVVRRAVHPPEPRGRHAFPAA